MMIKKLIKNLFIKKADLNSPSLTGIPTAPTATSGDDSIQIANTEFVNDAIGLFNELGVNYLKMENGLLLCWGVEYVRIVAGSLSVDTVITLPESYLNASQFVVVFGSATGTGYSQNVAVPSTIAQTENTITVRCWRKTDNTTAETTPAYAWLAIGRWE